MKEYTIVYRLKGEHGQLQARGIPVTEMAESCVEAKQKRKIKLDQSIQDGDIFGYIISSVEPTENMIDKVIDRP